MEIGGMFVMNGLCFLHDSFLSDVFDLAKSPAEVKCTRARTAQKLRLADLCGLMHANFKSWCCICSMANGMRTMSPEEKTAEVPGSRQESRHKWITWPVTIDADPVRNASAVAETRIRILQLILAFSAAALLIIGIRGIVTGGTFPLADFSNVLVFMVLFALLKMKPGWFVPVAWVGLLAFSINTVDGLVPLPPYPISPTHVLIPFMVLYGAMIGSLSISIAATLVVLGVYAFTGWRYWPLSGSDFAIITNLGLGTVCAGTAAFGAWFWNKRLLEKLSIQGEDLKRELDTRLRLNAILFHDISTPLTGLLGSVDMASAKDQPDAEDIDAIRQMSERIEAIVRSTRDMETKADISRENVTVRTLWEQLKSVFAARLGGKSQKLVLGEGGDIELSTNAGILCNSVLGNLVSNAIKFSPRGADIEVAASAEGDSIRIEIRDKGRGFPDDVLALGPKGKRYKSEPGTEGEAGSAYGLRITALCAHRLRGRLELRNRDEGGAAVAVVLPRS